MADNHAKLFISYNKYIMSHRSKSFRLQRLTKTVGTRDTSISKYEPKQTFKLAAINSINRSVKYNDLSFISGRELNKLRKQPEIVDDIEYEGAHQNLSQIRKNFDSVRKQTSARNTSISKLKDEKRKLQIFGTELVDSREGGKKKVQDSEVKLENTKNLLSQAEMQKKVLQSIRNRLKSDKVVYDQRKFDFEKQLNFLKKQLQVFEIDRTDILESDDRTNKVYKKFYAQLKAEQNEREEHLLELENMLEQRQKLNNMTMMRNEEMKDIAERAMQDKDAYEKNWEKLYNTNRFLATMLRDKMEKEMSKFRVVENSFKIIKIATGVSDADTLVNKFLSKEGTYGDLLGKIAENEKRIQVLKQQSQQLLSEYKELKAEREVIDNTKISALEIESKLLNETQQRQKTSSLNSLKLKSWTKRMIRKMNALSTDKTQISEEKSMKATSQNLIVFLQALNVKLDDIGQESQTDRSGSKISDASADTSLNQSKIIRVKPRKGSKDLNDDSQGQNPLIGEQNDIVAGQRLEILKNNEKFMREIKKKSEQQRKLKMQQITVKKKEVEPTKPEKPQDQ